MLKRIIIILVCILCLVGCSEDETYIESSPKNELVNNIKDLKDKFDEIKNEIEEKKNDITEIFSDSNNSNQEENTKNEETTEYTKVTFDEMIALLDENALKAKKTYENQIVEVTGILETIDSDGDYISLSEVNNPYSFNTLTCYIEDDNQLDYVLNMKTGKEYTILVRITMVGEVLGYAGDIVEFVE